MATRGWQNVRSADLLRREWAKVKPSKYRNVKTVVDGIVFDSKKEAARYQELKALQHAGVISGLVCQRPFPLYCPAIREGDASWRQVCEYVADFSYDDMRTIPAVFTVEDVKGKRTAMYLLKRKWLALQNGIEIRET